MRPDLDPAPKPASKPAPKPDLLQLCPLDADLERALQARYQVHRAFEPEGAAAQARCRAAVTGGHVGLPAHLAHALPALEILAIYGVGYDKVDLDLARRQGYRVSNTPDVLTDDVADLAIGLTLAVLRQLVLADQHVRSGAWLHAKQPLGRRMSGRRIGILGMGRIGQAIARRLAPFTPHIGYVNRSDVACDYQRFPDLAALAGWCDVLIVAASASRATANIVDAAVLQALGQSGVLINVARGSLVDEVALTRALVDGVIGGAGLDVFADEPRVPQALLALPNVVLAAHIGSATGETRQAMADLVLANLDAHFAGQALPTAVL